MYYQLNNVQDEDLLYLDFLKDYNLKLKLIKSNHLIFEKINQDKEVNHPFDNKRFIPINIINDDNSKIPISRLTEYAENYEPRPLISRVL